MTQYTIYDDGSVDRGARGSGTVVIKESDLTKLPMKTLVAIYKRAFPRLKITKFQDRRAGARRVFPFLDQVANSKQSCCRRVRILLQRGISTEEIVDQVAREYPHNKVDRGLVNWNRHYLKQRGIEV